MAIQTYFGEFSVKADLLHKIPLPISNRNQCKIIETKGSLTAAKARLRTVRNDLKLKVRVAHQNLIHAIDTALLLRDEIFPKTG